MLDLIDRVNDLKLLPRTGWLLAGIRSPESIAEHCYATALFALLLAEEINQNPPPQGLAGPLVIERVLRMALVHDLAESILTDLPKRSADLLGRATKHAAEQRALQLLFATLPNGAAQIELCAEYAAVSTPEARLVHDADRLELLHQALRYEEQGQRDLADFWQDHTWYFPASAELYAALRRRRAALS